MTNQKKSVILNRLSRLDCIDIFSPLESLIVGWFGVSI